MKGNLKRKRTPKKDISKGMISQKKDISKESTSQKKEISKERKSKERELKSKNIQDKDGDVGNSFIVIFIFGIFHFYSFAGGAAPAQTPPACLKQIRSITITEFPTSPSLF